LHSSRIHGCRGAIPTASKAGSKWSLLRTILRMAVEGRLDISAHMQAAAQGWFDKQYKKQVGRLRGKVFQKSLSSGYIWVDFASIPQAAEARDAGGPDEGDRVAQCLRRPVAILLRPRGSVPLCCIRTTIVRWNKYTVIVVSSVNKISFHI
jgi:hypothetical protein